MIVELFESTVLFGAWTLIANLFAYSRRFFSLGETHAPFDLRPKTIGIVFAIYLGATMLLAPVVAQTVRSFYGERGMPFAAIGWVQLLTMSAAALLLFLYAKTIPQGIRIWKDKILPRPHPLSADFAFGATTWFLSFPAAMFVGQIADLLIYSLFGVQEYEQVAVRYLKMALSSPSFLFTAILTIVIAAPFIEEFLFRGCLQSYLKGRFGARPAIFLSSLCFALFHLAPSQGWGNLSLALSLFTFALYLGLVYEKRGSLLASIALHMTFNAVSCAKILMLPD